MITPEVSGILALIFSTAAILFSNPFKLIVVLAETVVFLAAIGLNPFGGVRKFRGIIGLFIGMALLQNLLSPRGEPLLTLWGHGIIFSDSMMTAAGIVLRVLVIAMTGYVFVSMGEKKFIDVMGALGIPDIVLTMTVVGLKFIPIIRDEVRDMLNSVRLRGLEPNDMGFRDRARFFLDLSVPLVFSTLNKASRIAAVLEARGIKASGGRRKRLTPGFFGWLILLVVTASLVALALS